MIGDGGHYWVQLELSKMSVNYCLKRFVYDKYANKICANMGYSLNYVGWFKIHLWAENKSISSYVGINCERGLN